MEGVINLAELMVGLYKLTIEPMVGLCGLTVEPFKSSLHGAAQCRKFLWDMVPLVGRVEVVEN